MRFVPQKGSPMACNSDGDTLSELLDIAVMRMLFPNALIPASLDVDGLEGLEARLNAGANVITSIIPPNAGLAGVSQFEKDIDCGGRTLDAVRPVLDKLRLRLGTNAEYNEVIGR